MIDYEISRDRLRDLTRLGSLPRPGAGDRSEIII
jgi:hypothetical protein